MKYIREKWQSYLQNMINENAGPIHIDETRKAFYAGAISMCKIIPDIINNKNDKPLVDVHNELKEFFRNLKES